MAPELPLMLQEWATALLGEQYAAFQAGGLSPAVPSSSAPHAPLSTARTALSA